jgi:hypothetical protein
MQKKGKEFSESFQTLAQDVNAFTLKLREYGELQKSWDDRVDELDTEINDLKGKLTK